MLNIFKAKSDKFDVTRQSRLNPVVLSLERVTLPDISHMPVIALALIIVTFSINDSEVIPDD